MFFCCLKSHIKKIMLNLYPGEKSAKLFWKNQQVCESSSVCCVRSVVCALTGKMARFQFPGKPAKFSVKKTRVLSCKSRENGDRMVNVERTGRYLADFYTMVGDSDEDEVCFCFDKLRHAFVNGRHGIEVIESVFSGYLI